MDVCLLADNQFITSEGISALLKKAGMETIFRVETTNELQEKLATHPDALVVIDYTLFNFVSMQQMLNLKTAAKESYWLLFSDELSEHFLRYVLVSDPTISVVMKQDSREEIINALQNMAHHIPYICSSAREILDDKPVANAAQVSLTASEKMILHEIALGKTTKEIAYEKNVSFHTVNSHRKNIFRKLGVNNLHEAIRYAIRAGIFNVAEYYI
ncbi:MAG: response regulator transcription factor [Tannerellaceae bacterium]|jgi:DNA-binding NarL/FixJ family response regulator|nr:response regulator transcription factor [Tannerellaceae bacterium]